MIQALATSFRAHNLERYSFFCFVQNSKVETVTSTYKVELLIRVLLTSFPSQISLSTLDIRHSRDVFESWGPMINKRQPNVV